MPSQLKNDPEGAYLMRTPEDMGEGPYYLIGTVSVFNTWFHMLCFLVDPKGEEEGEERRPHPDMPIVPREQLEDAWAVLEPDACFEVTTIPGYEGEYIILITPYCD